MAYAWVQPIETLIEDWKEEEEKNQDISFLHFNFFIFKIIIVYLIEYTWR